jgi:hypothetical protein
MHADDGVKGYFIGDWKRLVLSAYQPPDMLAMRSQIMAATTRFTSRSSLLPEPCPFGKKTTTRPINTQRLHGALGSTEILQTSIPGTLLPCLVALTLYQNMSISRIALPDLNPRVATLWCPLYILWVTGDTLLTLCSFEQVGVSSCAT